MQQAFDRRTPAHLWVVGVVSLLWNSFGAYDYLMTRTRNMEYLSSLPGIDAGQMLAYIDSFPIWAQAAWGLGVWGSFAGSILLLLRSWWAVPAFALSLIGAILSHSYQWFGPPAPAGMDEGAMVAVPMLIIAVCLALLLYSRAMQARGVLR